MMKSPRFELEVCKHGENNYDVRLVPYCPRHKPRGYDSGVDLGSGFREKRAKKEAERIQEELKQGIECKILFFDLS
jgi:hypothetical protein